jgi:hypothetical protein
MVVHKARLSWFFIMVARYVWVWVVPGSWASGVEREGAVLQRNKILLPLPLRVQGKKKHSAVQNGTVSCSSLFFLRKRRCFEKNTSFHLKKGHQNTIFQNNPSIHALFSVWFLVSDFFNQVPNWPLNFNIYAIKPLI